MESISPCWEHVSPIEWDKRTGPSAIQRDPDHRTFVFILNEYGAFRCFPNVRRGGARRNQDNVRSANGCRGNVVLYGQYILDRKLVRPSADAVAQKGSSLAYKVTRISLV